MVKRGSGAYLTVAISMVVLMGGPVQANLLTGTISDWGPGVFPSLNLYPIGDGANHVTLDWSWASTTLANFNGSSFTGDSDVALAAGVTDIAQIADASTLSFSSGSVTAGVGDFIVWRNVATDYYGVLRLDEITGTVFPASSQFISGTWWFQMDGTGNFNDTVVPVPGAVLLGAMGLGCAGWRLRRKTC